MEPELDAYKVLQVDPRAEEVVLEAAHRALARRYHPDGDMPDVDRMAEINRAYDLVRTTERRKRYDRMLGMKPMGPGGYEAPHAIHEVNGKVPAPDRGDVHSSDPAWAMIDFGRYQGWRLKDLAKHDPDYLRFLSRHSSGMRFRRAIQALLPDEAAAPTRR